MLTRIVLEPGTTLAYHGWPPRRSDRERVGFAMPASVVRGEITHAYTQRVARRGLTRILLDLEHASGPAQVRYLEWSAPVDRPPFASSSEVHLEIEVPRLDVDEELERAIAGLDPILGEGKIWSQYAPTGGSLGVRLYLAHLPGSTTTGIRLDLDVLEVGCTLATFPVPVQSATGRIEVVSTLDGETGSSWRLDGTAGSATFRVQGRERSRWSEEGEREPILSTLAVRARGLDVNGPVIDVLGESTRDSVAGLVLEGKVDADLATYASGSLRRGLELRPVRGLSSTPLGFPDRVDDLHGTLRLAWNDAEPSEEPDTRGWVPGLEGSGPAGEHVLFTGGGTREGWGGSVFGTGISASIWSADEALSGAASAESELSMRGVVDIEATIAQSPLSGEQRDPSAEDELADETWTTRLAVVLRSNTLSDGGSPLLEELEGRFTMADGIITASEIKGRLGETEVFFEDLHLKNDATALTLATKIHATGIPLDAEHLDIILDEELLTSLVEELGLRGTIDVNQGTLQVIAPREGNRTVRFSGQLAISDMALEAGLPVVIQSAQASVRDLIVEDGELRAWGRIENLYGNCFDSELGPASALVSYVGGVLVVEDFSGSFERGTIRPLDGDSDTLTAIRGRPALRIALQPPFPYHASIAVDEVDAARWLEGLSPDAVTSSGVLSVEADISGNLGTLLETSGRGSIHLERSQLWSIPLFRELLREFGLDHTVMFDEVRFDFEINDRVVRMEKVVLRSPLLKLVGEGTLDMEGRLDHRLEVHYSIVDKITPLRRLFYLVQNIFVSVTIRGDLSRPLVRLSNGLFFIFLRDPEVEPSLPLPGLSPLPVRF